jgi:hypothetical protein
MFALMIERPPRHGRSPGGPGTRSPWPLASPWATVWAGIALSYRINWPLGF